MAIRYAVANGLWSATSTWDGGTLPANTDDVYSNNFTVSINQSITVNSLKKIAVGSPVIAAGGTFQVTTVATVTITAGIAVADALSGYSNVLYVNAGSAAVTINALDLHGAGTNGANQRHAILVSASHTGIITLNANAIPNAGGIGSGIHFLGTGTLIFTGTVGSNGGGNGISDTGPNSQFTINGNVTAGVSNSPISIGTGSTLTVTGNVTGGNGAFTGGITPAAGAHVIVNGDVIGGTSAPGVEFFTANGDIVVNGNVRSVTGSGIATSNSGTGVRITVNGNAIAGAGAGGSAIYCGVGGATVIVTGTVTGGSSVSTGVTVSGTSTITATAVIGGSGASAYGIQATGASNTINLGTVTAGVAHGINVNSTTTLVNIATSVVGSSSTAAGYGVSTTGALLVRGTVRPGNGGGTGSLAINATGIASAVRISGNIYGGGMIANSGPTGFFPIQGAWGGIADEELNLHLYTAPAWPGGLAAPITPLSKYGTNLPEEEDVQEGIAYGPGDALVGTFPQVLPFTLSDIAAVTGTQIAAAMTVN